MIMEGPFQRDGQWKDHQRTQPAEDTTSWKDWQADVRQMLKEGVQGHTVDNSFLHKDWIYYT